MAQLAWPDGGFVLLLAFFGALVLLLSSLSIQAAVLQARSSEFTLQRRRQQEDALASAAQLIAARLAAFPCALWLPSKMWRATVASEPPCIPADALARLERGTLPAPDEAAGEFVLLGYEPVANGVGVIDTAQLSVQWRPARGRVSQRRFRVELALASSSDGALIQPQLVGVRP